MAKKVKDYYDFEYAGFLAEKINSEYPTFDSDRFISLLREGGLEKLEFNDRQRLLASALKACIPLPYAETLEIFSKILGPELKGSLGMFSEGFWLWPIGKYVEIFGADSFDKSAAFSKELTKRFTGEFCMRPLLAAYPEKTIALMLTWSTDENKRVRRLASECLRIRLPWAKKCAAVLDYFDIYFQVLSNLRNDPDKTIQKSVANNLNDLYREAPEKFEYILESWRQEAQSEACEWIIRHASRTKRKEINPQK